MPHDFKLWCEDCQKGYEGECEEHGPLTHVSDTEVGTRARRSIPHLLELKEGKIRTGVFAKERLAKRLQFGPLQGIVESESRKQLRAQEEIRNRYGIVFKLVQENDDLFLLDTRYEEHSNWMIFVKAAETKSEQNLVAFQYKGEIFFATIKEVPAQCELKVWFSKDYAERMGTRTLSDEGTSWQFRTRQRFNCLGCGVVFSSASSLANHQCSRKRRKGKVEGFLQRKKFKRFGVLPSEKPSTSLETPAPSLEVKLEEVERLEREEVSSVPKKFSGKAREKKRGLVLKQKVTTKLTPPTDSSESEEEPKSPEKGAAYQCSLCEKVFHSPGKLKQHSYSHTGERPFSCPHCQKAFSSRFKLGRHQLIHTSERQHQCPLCKRSFHRKDHLKNHIQIHDPNKQFKCERPNCGKEYNSYMSYRKHCAVHAAEEGDLECKICLEMFDTKSDLIYHLKVHVGTRSVKSPSEKKFQCDQCDRRFFTRKDVKRHMVVHTGKRDFVCSFCPQKFGRKDHLVRHVKKSHGIPDPSRVESSSADPLAIAGPSSVRPTLSPEPASTSASSGDHSLSSLLMGESISSSSKPFMVSTLLPHQQTLPPEGSYASGSFPSDFRFFEEGIKEEPELTASMESISPIVSGGDDISRMLGMYLPAGSMSLPPVPPLLEMTDTHEHILVGGNLPALQMEEGESESMAPPPLIRVGTMFGEEGSIPPSSQLIPVSSSKEEYGQICSLPTETMVRGVSPEQESLPVPLSVASTSLMGLGFEEVLEGAESTGESSQSPQSPTITATTTSATFTTITTTTSSGSGTSSSSLPGFDQAFP